MIFHIHARSYFGKALMGEPRPIDGRNGPRPGY